MIAIPAALVYFLFAALGLFVLTALIGIGIGIALLINIYRLAVLAREGAEEARAGLARVRNFFAFKVKL